MIKIPEARKVDVRDITPSPRNTKKHPQSQINNVAKSIERFGFVQPLVLDDKNEIIIGHCRLSAAKKLGMKQVPCVYVEDLSEEDIRALRILDNKLNESDWDFEILADELKDLDFSEFEELDFGIEEPEKPLDDIVEDEPPALEEEAEPTTKPGDIWQLGDHRLMCGDSTNPADVEKLIGGGEIDLVVTDPPYNVDYKGGTKDHLKIENDNLDSDAFYQFLLAAFANLYDCLKPGGAFYIWHADSNGLQFRQACEENQLHVRQCLIWNKNSLVLGRQDYQWKHEPCLYGWKDGAGHYFIDERTNTTVYEDEIDVDKLKKEELKELLKQYLASPIPTTVINEDKPNRNEDHPTMKPVRLFAWLIRNSSRVGESVCDLFGGSGTTIVASEQLNRKAYVMEYDPKYCDVIIKRWEALTGQTAQLIQGKEKEQNV